MNGSIDHRPDRPSPWRARYTGADGNQKSKSFKTKDRAQSWLRDQLGAMDRGEWLDPAAGRIPYREHAEQWLSGLVNIKEKTRVGYELLLRTRVLPTFGNTQVRRIDPATVRAWVAAMHQEGLSASRIRQARQVLRASLEQAVVDRRIARNPTAGVKVPIEQPREMRFLTAEQVRDLAEAANRFQPGAGGLVTFLAYSGLRWSEAVALRRSAFDPLRSRIRVREAATEISGKLVHGTTKTYRTRTVVFARSVAELVASSLSPGAPDDLVFTAPRGGPLRSANFRKSVWLPAVAELAEHHPDLLGLRVHDLRHTAASLAISCGANVKAVQKMLGHKKASMTLDLYAHLYTEDLEDLAERMDARYRSVA